MLSDKKIIVPQNLINLAKNTPSIAVGIVCAHHPSIMQSSKQAFELDLINPTFIGKLNLIQKLLLMGPFIYFLYEYLAYKNTKIPLQPEWKICFKQLLGDEKGIRSNIVNQWDWDCGEEQTNITRDWQREQRNKSYLLGWALMLLGILCTIIHKRFHILNHILLRFFTVICIILSLVVGALSWKDEYGLYSGFILARLNAGFLSMILFSLLTIFAGFLTTVNK